MIQDAKELDEFHKDIDPWKYESNKDDILRKEILLSELPIKKYKNVLDIGCGQGFLTRDLPGQNVFGVDLSEEAILHAKKRSESNITYKQGSIFEIDQLFDVQFDLVVITGVLYPQYVGKSSSLIYLLIDKILAENGILVSVHINEWYNSQFPYLKIKQLFYEYREYTHNLEIYIK